MATVLGDLVGRDRRSWADRAALRTEDRTVGYREFCTTAWKAGHALRHVGVHNGTCVALAADPTPPIVETAFGAALLGARVTFDVEADARVVMAGVDREGEFEGDRTVVVYGGPPATAETTHWERVVWSENPTPPPHEMSPDDAVLDVSSGGSYTHREVLDAAAAVVATADLDAETTVALGASLTDPRAVVAGVVAPLLAGGTVALSVAAGVGDVAVGDGTADRRLSLDDVSL